MIKAPPDLENGAADLWLTATGPIGEELLAGYAGLLSAPERERWQRFRVRSAADQFLIARALLRTTLSRYAPVPERDWGFAVNPYGCPSIAEPASARDLRFNLSHTEGLVACAVTWRGEVGVDVENSAREIDPLELAPTVFASEEVEAVTAAPAEERRARFFAYWTLKEAYIKARSMGVSLALDGFWFELEGDAPRIHFNDRCPDRPERWHFFRSQPTASHALAVALAPVAMGRPRLRTRWVVPALPHGTVRIGLP